LHTETNVHEMKQDTGHVLSLFYKISRMTLTFLPVLHKLKDPTAVKNCSSTS